MTMCTLLASLFILELKDRVDSVQILMIIYNVCLFCFFVVMQPENFEVVFVRENILHSFHFHCRLLLQSEFVTVLPDDGRFRSGYGRL